MITGIVKMWKQAEGWGFIEGDDGEDYFINISEIRKGQVINIKSKVKFDIFQGQRGPEATNITLF